MKILARLKVFWKLFIPTTAIVVVALLCSILVASSLIKSVYLSNLAQELKGASIFVDNKIKNTIAVMKMQISLIEKNGDLAIAALYAFDDLVQDNSFLMAEIKKTLASIDANVIVVKSPSSGDSVSITRSGADLEVDFGQISDHNDVHNEGAFYVYRGKVYIVSVGQIGRFGENLASVFIYKEIDHDYLESMSHELNAEMLLLNSDNKILESSSDVEFGDIVSCNDKTQSPVVIGSTDRYYYDCIAIGTQSNTPVIAHLHNSGPLWHAIRQTNLCLWTIGIILIGVSIILTMFFCKSFILLLRLTQQYDFATIQAWADRSILET